MITAEPGSMIMMNGDFIPQIESGGCGPGCRRCCCAGESFFRLIFENKTESDRFIAISPPQPGKVIPISLDRYSGITLKPRSFLGALGKDWKYQLKLVRNVGVGCCGGQGFFLSELHGSGTAFIHGMGTVEILELKDGEKMVLENHSLVAFEKTVTYDVRQTGMCRICYLGTVTCLGGCTMICCGGMGLFNVVVTGPGLVIVQSLSLERLRWAIGAVGGGNSRDSQNRNGQ